LNVGLRGNPVTLRFLTMYRSCHSSGADVGDTSGVDALPPHDHGHGAWRYASVVEHGGPASRAWRRPDHVAAAGHAAHGAWPRAGGGAGVPREPVRGWDLHGKHSAVGSRWYGFASITE